MREALTAILMPLLVSAAFAQEMPESPHFLEGTALYAQNVKACPANANSASDAEIEGSLQLNRSGIFGNEFGCTFVAMHPEKDPESGIVYGWVAIAQCGDDSGITRPDMMSLIHNDDNGELIVQSQNEYVVGELMARAPDRDPDIDPMREAAFVSGTYTRCP